MADIEFQGTGGIIEGNLGTANVNVNLDPIYGNFNADTSSSVSNDNDFDDIWDGNGGLFSAWIYPKSMGEGNFGRIADKNQWYMNLRDESSGFVRLNFVHDFSTLNGSWKTTDRVIPLNVWSHIALFYDSDSTSNDPVLYLNGVAQTLSEDTTPAGTRSSDASSDLYFGNNSSGTRGYDGYMMDIKIYKNTAWTQPEIAVLASKINVDKDHPDLPAPGPRLYLWWKAIADATTDSSGSGNNLTASNMGSVVYDEFHVDVYDNSTTTDGTFTITQGKVEGLSLTSLDLDGSSDKISSTSFTMDHNGATFAIWLKKDNATGNEDTIIGQAGDANQHWLKIDTQGDIEFRDYPLSLRCVEAIRDTNWHHLAVTLNGDTNGAIYVDGVAQTLEFNEITTNPTFDQHGLRGTIDDFDGKMRDSKVFDYALSAEQVASLYSGTYLQTPEHWWKMDDAGLHPTGEPYVEDYGTGTDSDGIRTGATWSNGTLDLDGNLTVAANGSLSLPRGNLDLASNLDVNCTTVATQFIHNNGKVVLSSTSSENELYTGGATFYNVDKTGSVRARLFENMTVENVLDMTSSTSYFDLDADGSATSFTLTMGTATSSGTIESHDAGRFRIRSNNSRLITVQGVSTLYPCNVTGNDWDWDATVGSQGIQLANMDFQVDVVTNDGGVKLILTGDCEFDAVTVSSGDDFDINGQRVHFGGIVTIASGGDLLTTNGGLIILDNNLIVTGAVEDYDNADVNMIVNAGTGHDWRLGASGGGGHWCENVLTNGTVTHGGDQIGPSSGSSAHNVKNIIVGSGTFAGDVGMNPWYLQDLTIATGGTVTAGSRTIDLYGDFTTSGGLLGASALTFDGTDDQVVIADDNSLDFTTALTMECWVKTTDAEGTFVVKQGGYYRIETKGGKANFLIFTGSNKSVTGTSTVNDGKWHHIAATYDQTNMKIYVDGKLENTLAETGTITTSSTQLILGSELNGTYYTGSLDEIRLFNVAKTEAQIRADMFQGGTLASSTGLVARYKCDEGTGTSLEDSSSNTNTGTLSSAFWAGSGTFTYGTSTLVMAKSGTQTINCLANSDVNNLTVNDGSTTQIHTINNTAGRLDVFGNFIINEKLKSHADSNTSGVTIKTADKTFSVGSDVKSTALAELYQIVIDHTGNTNIPECQIKILDLDNQSTVTATGDLTITTELEVNSGTTFNANTNTINTKKLDTKSGSTTDLRNSNLTFKVTTSGDSMSIDPSSTILSGNTLVEGFSVSSPTTLSVNSTGGIEIVGDVKFLKMQSGGDLTVIGSVVGCQFDDTTGNIRQFFHTLDTQQLLDADEAGDDDLRLEKPALDNANELQTG